MLGLENITINNMQYLRFATLLFTMMTSFESSTITNVV